MLNVSQIQWEKLMLKILCLNIFLIPLSIVIISLLLNLITLVNQIIWASTFVVVPLLSGVWLFATPWTAARQASLSFIISWSLLNLTSIESTMPSHHLTLCHLLLLLPSVFPSLRVFSSESALCTRWPKYWSFSFSNSPSSEYWGLISFRIDWLGLLAVQGTLKSLLQHHDLKASIFSTQPCLWSATSLHDYWKVKSLSRVQLFATPWTVACPSPPSMEFSRQEYWRVPGSSPSWSRVFEGETA